MNSGDTPSGGGAKPPSITLGQWHEYLIRHCLAALAQGDPLAARRIHGVLADALRRNELTHFIVGLLADMHERLALGEPIDGAMLMQKQEGRPTNVLRDQTIAFRVEELLGMGHSTTATEAYKAVAIDYNLDWKSIKRIHLKYRPKLGASSGGC
jgi:hypothetical protein